MSCCQWKIGCGVHSRPYHSHCEVACLHELGASYSAVPGGLDFFPCLCRELCETIPTWQQQGLVWPAVHAATNLSLTTGMYKNARLGAKQNLGRGGPPPPGKKPAVKNIHVLWPTTDWCSWACNMPRVEEVCHYPPWWDAHKRGSCVQQVYWYILYMHRNMNRYYSWDGYYVLLCLFQLNL